MGKRKSCKNNFVELPCAIGDKVYCIQEDNTIKRYEVYCIEVFADNEEMAINAQCDEMCNEIGYCNIPYCDISFTKSKMNDYNLCFSLEDAKKLLKKRRLK